MNSQFVWNDRRGWWQGIRLWSRAETAPAPATNPHGQQALCHQPAPQISARDVFCPLMNFLVFGIHTVFMQGNIYTVSLVTFSSGAYCLKLRTQAWEFLIFSVSKHKPVAKNQPSQGRRIQAGKRVRRRKKCPGAMINQAWTTVPVPSSKTLQKLY